MKKLLPALLLGAFLLSGCAAKDSGNSLPVETNRPGENMSNTERTEEPEQTENTKQTEDTEQAGPEDYSFPDGAPEEGPEQPEADSSQQNLSEKIAMEISDAEEREKEIEKKQMEAVTQMDMNITAAEMYQMWDDTLNIVWGLLEANMDEADMEILRKEEREWITSRDAEVQAAGQECEGGSIQPAVEATTAADLTKARVYELAEYAK